MITVVRAVIATIAFLIGYSLLMEVDQFDVTFCVGIAIVFLACWVLAENPEE